MIGALQLSLTLWLHLCYIASISSARLGLFLWRREWRGLYDGYTAVYCAVTAEPILNWHTRLDLEI